MLVILILGFSSGLPITLVGGMLQAWFRSSGVDLVTVGCLSLIGQPYTCKFLWAPILDRFYLPFLRVKFLDLKRGWIIACQILIITIVIFMSFWQPQQHPILLGNLGFLLACVSATQDLSIDGYRVAILAPAERGLGSALAVEGYRLAMIVSGGVGFILADHIGWQKTYICMAFLMLLGVIGTLLGEPVKSYQSESSPTRIKQVMLDPIKQFLKKSQSLRLLALVCFYKIGDALSHSLTSVFFIDLGFSLTSIGTINKIVGVFATLLGVMFAGVVMVRASIFKTMLFFGFLQGVTNLLYIILAAYGRNYYLATVVVFTENLCSGMGTSALLAFITSLCDPKYSSAQFALLSSCASIGRVYIGPIAGYLSKTFGWQAFYVWSASLALPGILLTLFLKKQIMLHDQRTKS